MTCLTSDMKNMSGVSLSESAVVKLEWTWKYYLAEFEHNKHVPVHDGMGCTQALRIEALIAVTKFNRNMIVRTERCLKCSLVVWIPVALQSMLSLQMTQQPVYHAGVGVASVQ